MSEPQAEAAPLNAHLANILHQSAAADPNNKKPHDFLATTDSNSSGGFFQRLRRSIFSKDDEPGRIKSLDEVLQMAGGVPTRLQLSQSSGMNLSEPSLKSPGMMPIMSMPAGKAQDDLEVMRSKSRSRRASVVHGPSVRNLPAPLLPSSTSEPVISRPLSEAVEEIHAVSEARLPIIRRPSEAAKKPMPALPKQSKRDSIAEPAKRDSLRLISFSEPSPKSPQEAAAETTPSSGDFFSLLDEMESLTMIRKARKRSSNLQRFNQSRKEMLPLPPMPGDKPQEEIVFEKPETIFAPSSAPATLRGIHRDEEPAEALELFNQNGEPIFDPLELLPMEQTDGNKTPLLELFGEEKGREIQQSTVPLWQRLRNVLSPRRSTCSSANEQSIIPLTPSSAARTESLSSQLEQLIQANQRLCHGKTEISLSTGEWRTLLNNAMVEIRVDGNDQTQAPHLLLLPLNAMSEPHWISPNHQHQRLGRGSKPFLRQSRVISRAHCEIWFELGRFYVMDVGSQSGTFVNGQRLEAAGLISKPRPLESGDLLQLGVDFGMDGDLRCAQLLVLLGSKQKGEKARKEKKSKKKAEKRDSLNTRPPLPMMEESELKSLVTRIRGQKSRLPGADCQLLVQFGDLLHDLAAGKALLARPDDNDPSYSIMFNNYRDTW